MIKASELRIGNFISDDDGVLAKIIGFGPFEHSVRCDEEEGCQLLVDCYHANGSRRSGCAADSPECNAIPLTPEWLARCGFNKLNAGWINSSGSMCFYDKSQDVKGFYMMDYGTRNYNASFQFVHQLQNLYFALTGQELKIEL